ncbi:hypothetical protein HELRODRAFT_167363 [Helobdella robusta]|uniref:Uncharacterized protein n=1 Tax=Helobdella robusta TaxID=6412 RepID=T1EZB1_HELRO|nr:hypothetical protein HELRODRAFT_167363 [Helobdella robusta]ESO10859.1 hypothetical protein HELRODRAFT_167363 [Helobdella robusta]
MANNANNSSNNDDNNNHDSNDNMADSNNNNRINIVDNHIEDNPHCQLNEMSPNREESANVSSELLTTLLTVDWSISLDSYAFYNKLEQDVFSGGSRREVREYLPHTGH